MSKLRSSFDASGIKEKDDESFRITYTFSSSDTPEPKTDNAPQQKPNSNNLPFIDFEIAEVSTNLMASIDGTDLGVQAQMSPASMLQASSMSMRMADDEIAQPAVRLWLLVMLQRAQLRSGRLKRLRILPNVVDALREMDLLLELMRQLLVEEGRTVPISLIHQIVTLKKPVKKKFILRDSVALFVGLARKKLGINPNELFEDGDLIDARSDHNVITTLVAIARNQTNNPLFRDDLKEFGHRPDSSGISEIRCFFEEQRYAYANSSQLRERNEPIQWKESKLYHREGPHESTYESKPRNSSAFVQIGEPAYALNDSPSKANVSSDSSEVRELSHDFDTVALKVNLQAGPPVKTVKRKNSSRSKKEPTKVTNEDSITHKDDDNALLIDESKDENTIELNRLENGNLKRHIFALDMLYGPSPNHEHQYE